MAVFVVVVWPFSSLSCRPPLYRLPPRFPFLTPHQPSFSLSRPSSFACSSSSLFLVVALSVVDGHRRHRLPGWGPLPWSLGGWGGTSHVVVPYASVEFPHPDMVRVSLQPRGLRSPLGWGFLVGSLLAMVALGAKGGQWHGTREEMVKTNHDFHRGSLSGRTIRASHFLGPHWCSSLSHSYVEQT
jgi:hypothetical protein